MGDITEHFSWWEFQSKDGALMPPPVRINIVRTAEMLEKLRGRLTIKYGGDHPLKVLSGYRSPEHNAAEGGAKDSQHVPGKASDVTTPDLTPAQVQEAALELQAEGEIGGVGTYPGFTHVDWGPKRTWTYADKLAAQAAGII
jgi:uncharacterized protein YcbK (DUF882 family)